MNEQTGTEGGTLGRRIAVFVFGDTADEIELAALDEARKFFGQDVRLTIVRDYRVSNVDATAVHYHPDAEGKRYAAAVTVAADR